jgi:hypothetical protein
MARKLVLPPPPPATGCPVRAQIADVRDKFAVTGRSPGDAERTAAFIQGKIDMIKGDDRLSTEAKRKAIADLTSQR